MWNYHPATIGSYRWPTVHMLPVKLQFFLLAGCCIEQKKPKVIFIIGTYSESEYVLCLLPPPPPLSLCSLFTLSLRQRVNLVRRSWMSKTQEQKQTRSDNEQLVVTTSDMQLALARYYSLSQTHMHIDRHTHTEWTKKSQKRSITDRCSNEAGNGVEIQSSSSELCQWLENLSSKEDSVVSK